jgi:hypoxanthine phosphoribosyltransferase
LWYIAPAQGIRRSALVNSEACVRLLYDREQIREAVGRIARAIEQDHGGQEVHLLGILKGSFVFVADLARELKLPCTVDFVRLSSYGSGTTTSGQVEERLARKDAVTGRRVLVVDEIVDSGRTLSRLLADLAAEKPLSLQVCALVDKTGRREVEVPVHYRGFALDDGFLVGYGLDWDERYRNLDSIHVMEAGETSTAS